jgi:hypothetical protein
MLLLADMITKESTGTAGMVGAVLALVAIISKLISQRSHKNGNGFVTKKDVEALFVKFKNPSEAEKTQRNKTRERLLDVHRWAEEERGDRKELEKTSAEILRRIREIGDCLKRIERQ